MAESSSTTRLNRLVRLARVLDSEGGCTVESLATRLHVSRRTVSRDLQHLAEAGIQYTFDRQMGCYSYDETTKRFPITLNTDESLILLLMAEYMGANGIGLDYKAAASVGEKLKSLIPEKIRDEQRLTLSRIRLRESPCWDVRAVGDILLRLRRALTEQRTVFATYDRDTPGELEQLVLHPYCMVHTPVGWYLIAFSESSSEVTAYHIDRFIRLGLTSAPYVIDPAFELEEFLGNAWFMIREGALCRVRVRFSRQIAHQVQGLRWHRTQATWYGADGALYFEAQVDGIKEISSWIMGFGEHAQVIEPPELCALIKKRLDSMSANYRSKEQREIQAIPE